MTHVPGEVENNINTANQMVCDIVASDIGANEFDPIGNPFKVKRVSPLFRQQSVDNDHLHIPVNKASSKIAADKTHATGNQNGTTVILGTKVVQF